MKKSRKRLVLSKADCDKIQSAGADLRKKANETYDAACLLIDHATSMMEASSELFKMAQRHRGDSP